MRIIRISWWNLNLISLKKGLINVYVPTNTAKLAQAKPEKQPLKPAAEGLLPESSPRVAPESKEVQNEVEGHSIYVRNLPINLTVAQLEAEFQKFGTIKPNGVQVRSSWASPITIGDRQATVEIKRTTTRVGNGRVRFNYSHGGYRNENSRDRGNFSGGRSYGKNDSFRGRGNFSNGPGGEGGYQQGRGRGNRRSSPNQNPALS